MLNNKLSFPLLDQYYFEKISEDELWKFYEENFYMHYPLDVFFSEEELRSDKENNNLQLLNDLNITSQLKDSLLIKDKANDVVVAVFHGWQKNFDSYYMQFTAVHQNYRKKGIYSALIDRILSYTKELGFCLVLSCHSPFNNSVLIAKLKKDFKIIGMDIDAALGTNIWLCYFHNEDLKHAFEFRCGHIKFSKKLFSASLGTAEKLYKEIEKSSD